MGKNGKISKNDQKDVNSIRSTNNKEIKMYRCFDLLQSFSRNV